MGGVAPAMATIDENTPIVFEATVRPSSTALPMELGEDSQYYYIVLEVPGADLISANAPPAGTDFTPQRSTALRLTTGDVDVSCDISATGYVVAVTGNRVSAVEGKREEPPVCTRELGAVNWSCELQGVFLRGPEYNCHEGLLKLRFRKLIDTKEQMRVASF